MLDRVILVSARPSYSAVAKLNCPCCGLTIDRDHNAALNILRLGLQAISNQSVKALTLEVGE